MIFSIFFLSGYTFLLLDGSFTDSISSKYRALHPMANINFTWLTSWKDSAGSNIACATKCNVDSNCNSYGYNNISKACQGHRYCFLTTGGSHPYSYFTEMGTNYFILDNNDTHRQCTRRNVSDENVYWRKCNPGPIGLGDIGQPVVGRRIILEATIGGYGRMVFYIEGNSGNSSFYLTYTYLETYKRISTEVLVNRYFQDEIVHYIGPDGPALGSLFCMQFLITTEVYKVTINDALILERNVTDNFQIYDKFRWYSNNNFFVYEATVLKV